MCKIACDARKTYNNRLFVQKRLAYIDSSALLNDLYTHVSDLFEQALYLDKPFIKTYRLVLDP